MASTENIRVAVRVRPFSTREKGRKAKLIVSMDGRTTVIVNPNNTKEAPKKFTYDYSYWSHDGWKEKAGGYLEPAQPKYVDQLRVFSDLGRGLLDNAWEGYNCSLFAYGQTGSGKSYSVMGNPANKGLVPRTCEDLFKSIESRKTADVTFQVHFSMMEIYNEEVRDLLNKKNNPHGGLKVKERPERGFYVEGLTVVPVGNFDDIKLRMNEGDRQRTIASTKMNETSSRAHTIVTINFAQNFKKQKTTKSSSINLVDLAGSERVKQTEATGDRFQEAKNINKSLMTLGNVIKALCDQSKKKAAIHIPYRDAILTKLLKNALGGNSKTAMVAAISPDAENYEQTLSTLRYADRAKEIKTDAKVNQGATNAIIKDLIAEKERLLKELQSAKSSINKEEMERLKMEHESEIRNYKDQMVDMEKALDKRLNQARNEMDEMLVKENRAKEEEKKLAHFSNLNEDSALEGKLIHLIRPGANKIGNSKDGNNPNIVMNGPKIHKQHAVVTSNRGEVALQPDNGLILHNGTELTKKITLKHQDRIRFGSNNLFVFINPLEAEAIKKGGRQLIDVTYDFALSEIAKHAGLSLNSEDTILNEEVMSMMQIVYDVNGMAEDMDKSAEFSLILVSPEARGEVGRTEVHVKLRDLENGNEYLWNKNHFLNRQVHMQEAFQKFEDTGRVPNVSKEEDPFWEPADTDVIIGVASVPLKYLSHMLEFVDETMTILDYTAKQAGFLKVDLIPCDGSGDEDMDLAVEDPMDLVGKSVAFKVKVLQSMNLPDRFEKTWCRYKFYDDPHYITTDVKKGKNPVYDHIQMMKFRKNDVSHKFIEFLSEAALTIQVWGKQGDNKTSSEAKYKRRDEKQKQIDVLMTQTDELEDKLDRIRAIVSKMPPSPEVREIKKILK